MTVLLRLLTAFSLSIAVSTPSEAGYACAVVPTHGDLVGPDNGGDFVHVARITRPASPTLAKPASIA